MVGVVYSLVFGCPFVAVLRVSVLVCCELVCCEIG